MGFSHCGTLFGPKINPRPPMINARQPTGNLGAILGCLGSSWVVLGRLGSSWGRLGGVIAEFLDQLTPKTLILTTVSRFCYFLQSFLNFDCCRKVVGMLSNCVREVLSKCYRKVVEKLSESYRKVVGMFGIAHAESLHARALSTKRA